ncbi:hypothetical protein Tco_1165670 [Tanacetum coccineum]
MDDPNITMEEYIRLEEEKARWRGKVFNWETATYGRIWDDDEVHNLRSVETEFPAIVFDDTFTSQAALSCEPTISPLNDNEINFRISFDESDNEDYTVIFDKNSFSFKIIYVDNLKMDSENDNDKVNMTSFPSPKPTVSYFDDLDYLEDLENEFSAIVYNDALTSKSDFLTEPIVCPQHVDEFNLKDEISLSEYDKEEQNVLYFNDLFPFNVIYLDDSKSNKDNDDKPWGIPHDIALPPRDQRHQYLRFEGLEYTDADITDFKERLAEEMETAGFGLYWAESARDPILRLCHRLIACSIAGRIQAPKKLTVTDLFYLRGMDVGSVNIPYLLARYLRMFASGRKRGAMIYGGQFVAGLAEHFGLLTEERLQRLTVIVRDLLVIDMAELMRLHICEELNDTWAWVSPRPERQYLSHHLHSLRGALGEQREVLDSMTRDFSRFTTWMVTRLSRMMDQAEVRYTSYADFHIPYVRHTRRMTDDASTSAPQQPDP